MKSPKKTKHQAMNEPTAEHEATAHEDPAALVVAERDKMDQEAKPEQEETKATEDQEAPAEPKVTPASEHHRHRKSRILPVAKELEEPSES